MPDRGGPCEELCNNPNGPCDTACMDYQQYLAELLPED